MFNLNLDLTNVEASTGFGPLPNGFYLVQVEEAELKETQSGTGHYINAMFTIVAGPYKDRKLFHAFNIQNESEKAQQIGQSELKALIVASGSQNTVIKSPTDIEGLECEVRVKTTKEEGYDDRNAITSFRAPKLETYSDAAATTEIPKGNDGKNIF